jgi:hypothetical protein
MTEPSNFKSGGTQIFKALLAHFCPLSSDIRHYYECQANNSQSPISTAVWLVLMAQISHE